MPKTGIAKVKLGLLYKRITLTAALMILWLVHSSAVFPEMTPQDDDIRDIKPTSWYKERPKSIKPSPPLTRYKRVTLSLVSSPKTGIAEVGVTLWRLRPSKADDERDVRELIQENDAKDEEWTPERMDSITPIAEGEYVRLGIETPLNGYLYVINRARYADGSMGTPYLIFPTLKTMDGNNKVKAGRLIEIPARSDQVPYFRLRRSKSPSGAEEVGEEIILLIRTRPLEGIDLETRRKALPADLVAGWEKQWKGGTERWELINGKGKAYTKAEKNAADEKRELVQDDPYPQTIYRVDIRRGIPVMISVQLPILHN